MNFYRKNMVIYEVNLMIDKEVFTPFQLWLKEHVKKMISLPGFIQAHILKPEIENLSEQEQLTVQYQLTDREALTTYFAQYASKMREDGINQFKNKFSTQRRVFTIQESISQ
jgi:hypothetical protein